MSVFWILGVGCLALLLLAIYWLGWQLLRQNGRILLRLDEVEQRLNEIEFDETDQSGSLAIGSDAPEIEVPDLERAKRFSNRSLARSKIQRDGLKAGAVAPDFRLPRLDGRGDVSLGQLRGRRVLLVFSDPHCGPCQKLLPQLESFHRQHPEVEVLLISRGEPGENRSKVKEYQLTFTIVFQREWEISRRYAMFATPIAYSIEEAGIITHDVALGIEAIQELMETNQNTVSQLR